MIAKIIKGKGYFRGALEYCLRQGKGHIIDTNMAGSNPRSLACEFGKVRALRPNLKRVLSHVTLSIGPNESLTDDQWREAAQKYLKGMGFSESQYVVAKHTDTKHPHIHILAARVTMKGTVVSDSYDYRRQEPIMRRLEQYYGLFHVAQSKKAPRKALSQGEIEYVLRTGKASVRMRLQDLVDNALKEKPELRAFITQLASEGVETKLNQASTGRISGISFSLEGVSMKGSDLGKAFTWNSLQKRGLQYEQFRYGAEHESGFISGQEQGMPETRQGVVRSGDPGNALESAAATRYAEIEKQRRIDENFERLARPNQGCGRKHTKIRSRSKGISY